MSRPEANPPPIRPAAVVPLSSGHFAEIPTSEATYIASSNATGDDQPIQVVTEASTWVAQSPLADNDNHDEDVVATTSLVSAVRHRSASGRAGMPARPGDHAPHAAHNSDGAMGGSAGPAERGQNGGNVTLRMGSLLRNSNLEEAAWDFWRDTIRLEAKGGNGGNGGVGGNG